MRQDIMVEALKSYRALPFGMVLEVTPPQPKLFEAEPWSPLQSWRFKLTTNTTGVETTVTKEFVDHSGDLKHFDWVLDSMVHEMIGKAMAGHAGAAVQDCKNKLSMFSGV